MSKKNRIGERFISNEGYEMIIVEYNRSNDLWVEFQDEYKAKVHTQYDNCKKGAIRNPYKPNKYGGYYGQGKYKAKVDGVTTKYYRAWMNMLVRCYNENEICKHPTYEKAYVNEYFLNFQNFAQWYEDNYYEIDDETMCLDKDILVKGNKEYAPDKCVFVPHKINVLFIKVDSARGDYPIGVSLHDDTYYIARCNIDGYEKHIGTYNSPFEAFVAYKEVKEQHIKQIADEYKDRIPTNLYEAMYEYVVEIDD